MMLFHRDSPAGFVVSSTSCLLLLVFAFGRGSLSLVESLPNGLGLVPPMGWNSWNVFRCDIDEHKIKAVAQAMLPLQEWGYEYLNLDDCWMSHNRTNVDGNGNRYQGDPIRFPSGMADLGQYLHLHGFKFGIYTSAGTRTCAGYPGSLGHEEVDAQTFADWGVDFLKYDSCYDEEIPGIDRYTTMRDALNRTGRPIFYSLCQWGLEASWQWAPAVGNSWRTTFDIEPTWTSIQGNFWTSQQHGNSRSGPGHWLDPDMLEVGNGNLTNDENRAHFSLWCLVKAPLLLGNDLTAMTPETMAIISNTNLIRVNQDPTSPQATCFIGCGSEAKWSILATTISDGDATVVLVINWSEEEIDLHTLAAHKVGVVPPAGGAVVMVHDLWTRKLVGVYNNYTELKNIPLPALAPHSCVVYQMTPVENENHMKHVALLK